MLSFRVDFLFLLSDLPLWVVEGSHLRFRWGGGERSVQVICIGCERIDLCTCFLSWPMATLSVSLDFD